MKPDWTAWVTWRFLTGRKGGRGRFIFLFSILLLCAGVATLNTILAVMNGLQQGYIASILEIGSYHLLWTNNNNRDDIESLAQSISEYDGVHLAVPFQEGKTMISRAGSLPRGVLVRGISRDIMELDQALADQMEITDGEFNLNDDGIVLGGRLGRSLSLRPGDAVNILSLSNDSSSRIIPLTVSGLFSSKYYIYNQSMAFVSLKTADKLLGNLPLEIGIKLDRLDSDRHVLPKLSEDKRFSDGRFVSWRETNKAFFGALHYEKIMMFVLVALILVIVAVNIDQALRRMAAERVEDLGIFKAIGATPNEIRLLFLRHGLFIGGLGGISGSIFGVVIGANIDRIVLFIRSFGHSYSGTVESFFQHALVMPQDVLIIFILTVILTFLAAIRASSMAALSKPAEVLRSE